MHIRFAVAGGRGVGLGHVMRCAVIAGEAVERGHTISFALRGDGAAWATLLAELPGAPVTTWTSTAAPAADADWLVLDAPADIGPDLAAAQAAGVRACVLDRLDQLDVADATVLPVAHGPAIEHPRLFQGREWCLTAPVFRARADTPYPGSRGIALVTFGGADPLQLTLPATRALRGAITGARARGLEIHTIVGPAFTEAEDVARALEAMGCLLRRGPSRGELASLMARSAFAVSAFGTSLYDLASIGVPVVYWTHREADLPDALRLEAAGLGVLGGDGGSFSAADCQALLRITVLDPDWRLAASARGRALLGPADGARRIVSLLETGVPAEVPE